MRELAAHRVLYLRENPEHKDGIEQIIDQILEDRGKEESEQRFSPIPDSV